MDSRRMCDAALRGVVGLGGAVGRKGGGSEAELGYRKRAEEVVAARWAVIERKVWCE
jgi:hypothetical protein